MIYGEDLFVDIYTASKMMAGYSGSYPFLNSIYSNFTLYAEVYGLHEITYDAGGTTAFKDAYLTGLCRIATNNYYEPEETDFNELEASLFVCKYTECKAPFNLVVDTIASPRSVRIANKDVAQKSQVKVSELLNYFDTTGTPFDHNSICKFYSMNFAASFMLDIDDLDEENLPEIARLIERDELKKVLSQDRLGIEEKAFNAFVCKQKRELQKEVDESNTKNSIDKKGVIEDNVTDAYWLMMGIMFDFLTTEGKYKSKNHLKSVITSRYPSTRGLSERNMDKMLKRATDALDEIKS
jgi:hypothetical protein